MYAKRSLTYGLVLMLSVLVGATLPGQVPADVLAAPAAATPDDAKPRGPQPFVTLFCQFPDLPRTRGCASTIRGSWRPGAGPVDYWQEVSYGHVSLAGSQVEWLSAAAACRRLPAAAGPGDAPAAGGDCTAAADEDVFFPIAGINLVFNFCPDTAYGVHSPSSATDRKRYGITWLCTASTAGRRRWRTRWAHLRDGSQLRQFRRRLQQSLGHHERVQLLPDHPRMG